MNRLWTLLTNLMRISVLLLLRISGHSTRVRNPYLLTNKRLKISALLLLRVLLHELLSVLKPLLMALLPLSLLLLLFLMKKKIYAKLLLIKNARLLGLSNALKKLLILPTLHPPAHADALNFLPPPYNPPTLKVPMLM